MREVVTPERHAYETYMHYCQSLGIAPLAFKDWQSNARSADRFIGTRIIDLQVSKRGVIKC